MAARPNLTLYLMMEETAQVNSQEVLANPVLNLSLGLVTAGINIWAISVIRKKDKSGLNRMLMADCVANILWSPLVSIICVIIIFIIFHLCLNITEKGQTDTTEFEMIKKSVRTVFSNENDIKI